jgi:hypothetical protein
MGACRSGISADNGAPFTATFQDFDPTTGFQNLPEGLTAPSDLGVLCELSGPSQSDLIKVRFGALCGLKSGTSLSSGKGQRHRKCLFDHLIGELLDIHRQFEAERLGGFQINDKLELGRLLDRDVGGLNAA